jgi:hypothetical protein
MRQRRLAALQPMMTQQQQQQQQRLMRLQGPVLAVMLPGLLLSPTGTCSKRLLLLVMLLLCLRRPHLGLRLRAAAAAMRSRSCSWMGQVEAVRGTAAAVVVVWCSRWWTLPSQQLVLPVTQ